ncbi:hypothetical protein ABID58_007227 [Bradyrhizobium sp. S3.2.6]
MTTSAAKFIHDERGKQTFGKALGRALARLHADLRLFLCTRGQVSTGTAGYELANSPSGLSDLHATAHRSYAPPTRGATHLFVCRPTAKA